MSAKIAQSALEMIEAISGLQFALRIYMYEFHIESLLNQECFDFVLRLFRFLQAIRRRMIIAYVERQLVLTFNEGEDRPPR